MNPRQSGLLNAGGTLIVGSGYQRQVFAAAYARQREAAGAASWLTPKILTWSTWQSEVLIPALVAHGARQPVVLTGLQQRYLWQQAILASGLEEIRARDRSLLRMIQRGWQLLHDWRIPLARLRQEAMTDDTRLFAQWCDHYAASLAKQQWLDPATSAQWCLAELSARAVDDVGAAAHVLTPPTPLQAAVFERMNVRGTAAGQHGSVVACRCHDDIEELFQAVHWACATYRQFPAGRVAIVYPDGFTQLELLRQVLGRQAVTDGVAPVTDARVGDQALPPLVAMALDVLELKLFDNDWQLISALLTDDWPVLGARAARARLDGKLRDAGALNLALRDVRSHPDCVGALQPVRTLLDAHINALGEMPPRQSAFAWVQSFSRLLDLWQWPALARERGESHLLAQWQGALDRFASLGFVAGAMSAAQALSWLRECLAGISSATTASDTGIHLVSMAEAVHTGYDAIWFVGMSDTAWPPPSRAHPLLPVHLQRAFDMPEATPDIRQSHAKARIAAVMSGCDEVIVSWAERAGEAEQAPSAFAAMYTAREPEAVPLTAWSQAGTEFESIDDCAGTGIPPGSQVKGGAALLDDQSACPFRAYARFRLFAEPLEEPGPGLDASERGTLVHRGLQVLWQKLADFTGLLQTTPDALAELCDHAAGEALAHLERRSRRRLGRRFRAIERRRLGGLLLQWSAVERNRQPFRVMNVEKRQTVNISGLELTTQFDRVDLLADDTRLIIDYKTGRVSATDWDRDRKRSCQLPLYAIAERDVAGIAFAQVRQGDLKYVGIAQGDEGAGIKAIGDEWSARLDHWRETLPAIAASFADGQAAVDPAPQACQYCPYPGLCRIDDGADE
ncbi:MAG: PD-(D/E)XK nuclease family protein [Gammaproteobacteria bacterium]|nr:PD-(D/E)XK nuclease family protein [Gammaproteobacteria bacterium]